jgi:hypothetical protein
MIRRRTYRVSTALLTTAALTLAGCGETTETKTKVEQAGPGGTTTETKIDKVNQSGQNPPAPTGTTDAAAPK